MELFLSFYPGNKTRDGLMKTIEEAKQYGDGVCHRYETLHVTLDYLGEVADERYDALVEILRKVGQRHAPFTMKGEGRVWLSPDTSVYNARSLLYMLIKNEAIQAVFDDLSKELEAADFWHADHGGYMPHSTLFMSYVPNNAEEKVPSVPAFDDRFDSIILYQCCEIDGHVAYYPLFVQPLEG
ncbi:MAG: 2'-5' RNA ligase family protein [Oscillospiraceae bacterium]|nr:2'-5' RNA ligase family protein [Oscillospiraceae bacterium]